jgi:pimeloyl-ACP methyl ester carboxylesterase
MSEWSEGDVHANGITIHYYRTGGTNKPPILLLHGITDSGLCWSRVAHALEDSYDLIMTDARGHGRSSSPTPEFSLILLADDAAAVIRELGLDKPYVWGHSMGAITAALLAARYPELVRAIVLEDPPLVDRPPAVDRPPVEPKAEQQGLQGWQWILDLQALSREQRIAIGSSMNPDWVQEEIIPWADSKAQFQTSILQQALTTLSKDPWRDIIARIQCPILLLTGNPERKAIVTPDAAQEAAQLWKQGKVVHIIGAGHNIHRDRYDEAMAAVRSFLNSV